LVVVVPPETVGPGGPPGVSHDEIGRAVGEFHGVVVGGRAEEAPAQRVLLLFVLAPGDGGKRAALPGEALVRRGRAALPRPGTGRGGHHAHAKSPLAVPEAVNALFEVGAG